MSETDSAAEYDAPSPSIDALLPKGTQDQLIGAQREKIGADERVMSGIESAHRKGVARADKAFEAEGVEPGRLQPWDAEVAKEKYKTDPLESFGSMASVFAMVASAFTHAPMENSLNGAAAAMNAIKAGNDREFDRAYEAWQKNTDLAVKRFNMEHQLFSDSLSLMDKDMNAWAAQSKVNAARFGDQQSLFLLEQGLYEPYIKLQESRAKAAKGMQETRAGATEDTFKHKSFDTLSAQITETDPTQKTYRLMELYRDVYGVKQTPQLEAVGKFVHDHASDNDGRGPTGEEIAEFHNKNFGYGARPRSGEGELIQRIKDDDSLSEEEKTKRIQDIVANRRTARGSPQDQEISRRKAEYMKPFEEGGLGLSETEADTRARQDIKTATSAAAVKPDNVELKRRKDEYMKPVEEGGLRLSATEADTRARQDMKKASAVITGNRREQLQAQSERYRHSIDKIDNVMSVLNKYIGTAGAPGYARRLEERLSNMAGSNKTDFVQMMRDIEYLQLEAPRLLLGATGRPLSSEAGHINSIIAGLKAGDTTANTRRAMQEVQKLYRQMLKEQDSRIGGGSDKPADAEPSVPVPKRQPWLDAPVVGP